MDIVRCQPLLFECRTGDGRLDAGHGAVADQRCVAEMGVVFIDNPKRRFNNSCAESIKVDWHIAPFFSIEIK